MRLSIVVPTYNESENIIILIEKLTNVLSNVAFEIIVVDDDSPDGTALLVSKLNRSNIQIIVRQGKRGLSSAVIEGIERAKGEYVLVMDADLQHDEGIVPEMLALLEGKNLDIVVGSRYAHGGGVGEFSKLRSKVSEIATSLANKFIGLTINDPLSGFFIVKRSYVLPILDSLSGKGFKILLDIILSSSGKPKIGEVPYIFKTRLAGKSKLNSVIVLEYLVLLLEKRFSFSVPLDFVSYMLVGLFGVLVHLAVLYGALLIFGFNFISAQLVATLAAMASNFLLNNKYTFFQSTHDGKAFLKAALRFYLLCSLGLLINLSISTNLFSYGIPWYLAGFLGTIISATWNYMSSKLVVWR
jgi:dolichol-phosphate mannosyltransferase